MNNNRYISLNELPYIQQLARSIYLNNLNTPYQNNNNVLQFITEAQRVAKAQNKNTQTKPNINLLDILKRGYQSGVDLIPYRDINIDPHVLPTYGSKYSDLGFGG